MNPEWVEAGARALAQRLADAHGFDPTPDDNDATDAAAVIEAVAPLIRADERERQRLLVGSMEARHNLALADLRAQIVADIENDRDALTDEAPARDIRIGLSRAANIARGWRPGND